MLEAVKKGDYRRTGVNEVVQQILKAKMEETFGGRQVRGDGKPLELRQWVLAGDAEHAGWNCGRRRTGRDTSARSSSSATSGARKRWWER